jgi:hypothetical protein
MPNRNERPAVCSTTRVPSRAATWLHFVSDRAGQFVGRLRLIDKPLIDVDAAARQRHGIGLGTADNVDAKPQRQGGGRFEPADQPVERGTALELAGVIAAGEG